MGKRATLFKCHDCSNRFWEWFEHLRREELIEWCEETTCPECDSDNWEMTDTSEFAGAAVYGDEGYPKPLTGVNSIPELRQVLGIADHEERLRALERGDGA